MISIVTATWNSSAYLGETLASLRGLGPGLLEELIVVDGGSTDSTLELLNQSPLPCRVLRQKGKGVYSALMEGVNAARSKWVVFLHSDDLLISFPKILPAKLDEDIVYVGDIRLFRPLDGAGYTRRLPLFPRPALRVFPFIFHPNAIYAKKWLQAYPFRPELHGRKADMYQLAEMSKAVKFQRMPEFLYGFRIHEGSTTAQGIRKEKESRLYWLWRWYVFAFFEDNRWQRIIGRLRGDRIWGGG